MNHPRRLSGSTSSSEEVDFFNNPDFVLRVKDIVEKDDQPFARLNELSQMGAIEDLEVSDGDKVDQQWLVIITAIIAPTGQLLYCFGYGSKKAKAKAVAAFDCLQYVATELLGAPEYVGAYTIGEPAMNDKNAPTKRQAVIMEQDQLHLARLQEIQKCIQDVTMTTACVSLDLEVLESDHTVLLEVGISFAKFNGSTQAQVSSYHLIIDDNWGVRNGLYCPDNKEYFLAELGISESINLVDVKDRLAAILEDEIGNTDQMFWVGHTLENDLKWLRGMGLHVNTAAIEFCDIGRAYRALNWPETFHHIVGMAQMMDELCVDFDRLHNAGNDAFYNLKVLDAMFKKWFNA